MPVECLGETAVSRVAEIAVTLVAAVLPNFTAVTMSSPVPVIVTVVPPVLGPADGDTAEIAGAAAVAVKTSALDVAPAPPVLATVTS